MQLRKKLLIWGLVIVSTLSLIGTGWTSPYEYVPGELMVRFSEDLFSRKNDNGILQLDHPEIDRLLLRFHCTDMTPLYGGMIFEDAALSDRFRNDFLLHFPEKMDMELVASEFSQLKNVAWADPNYLLPVFDYTPDDPQFYQSWWLNVMQLPRTWDFQTGNDEVIVAAIDTGVDWQHPDLMDNIWVNPGEDIDGDPSPNDPRFPDIPGTLGDQNGIDDDNNGLIDDFIGWDWVSMNQDRIADGEDGTPDNDGRDFHGHGTGCTSAMVSVGDNQQGGIGVAFNCRTMVLRAGYENTSGDGSIQSNAATSAVLYATANGADVITFSYGGFVQIGSMRDATDAAWEANILLFGAAGNFDSDTELYPGNYEHVISVAATDRHDQRSSFSNYGNWVDIAAPGEDCITAWFFPHEIQQHGYATWSGTSISTPYAGGVGALVAAQYDELTNVQWRNYIETTTDPIEPDEPIGSGRINAYNATTRYYWPELSISDVQFSDPDGNGHPDAGETIDVSLTVENQAGWRDASMVNATLEIDHPHVTLDRASVLVSGNLPDGQSADNTNTPLRFTVDEDWLDGDLVPVLIRVNCQPNDYEIAWSETMLIGSPDLLLVDDDGGATYEEYLANDLTRWGYLFEHLDVAATQVEITAEDLSRYDGILWMTGDVENPLSPGEIDALSTALDNGTNLFLFGQTLDEQLAGTDFYRDYLHAAHEDGDGELGLESIDGAPQPPVIPDTRLILTGPDGAANNDDPDRILPLDGAEAAYEYMGDGGIGGIVYDGDDYKLAYFAFAFEAVGGAGNTTLRGTVLGWDDDSNLGILPWWGILSDVEENPGNTNDALFPSSFRIAPPYPNPFNGFTTLTVTLPERATLNLSIYNLTGQLVTRLASGKYACGQHSFQWKADQVATGMYIAVARSQYTSRSVKLLYLR